MTADVHLPRMAAGQWSDPAFAQVAEQARVLAGLVFPPSRYASAEAGMRRAMASLRMRDPAALVRAIAAPGAPRDGILAELTVGESYFFRESAHFELLTQLVEARRIAGNASPIRVWSAGCASGEEPYSIAILLKEQGWIGETRIIGTDIARPRLAAAQRGLYTRWALRGVSEQRIDRWFSRTGPHFVLAPTIREGVRFAHLNLAADDYPSNEHAVGGQDFVLCRNVMIYFDQPTIERIAARLLAALSPDGWLVLGASDPMLGPLVECEVLQTNSGLAYRRKQIDAAPSTIAFALERPAEPVPRSWASETAVRFPPVEPMPPPAPVEVATVALPAAEQPQVTLAPLRTLYETRDYASTERAMRARIAEHGPSALSDDEWALFVRTLANQGNLTEAGEWCALALEQQPLSAELNYLYATLLAQAGWFADAAVAARRAIYLDRLFVMGHLALADALAHMGKGDAAHRAFTNAATLLTSMLPDAVVAGSDSVPAGRLLQIAQMRLSALRVNTS